MTGKIVATYDYKDISGVMRYQAVEYDDKKYFLRRPDGGGHWIWTMADTPCYQDQKGDWHPAKTGKQYPETKKFDKEQPLIYLLPELIKARTSDFTVIFVDNEKDADVLTSMNITATTIHGRGFSPFPKDMISYFVGAKVLLVQTDKNKEFVNKIALAIRKKAVSVRIFELPSYPEEAELTGDIQKVESISDYFADGCTREQFIKRAEFSYEYQEEVQEETKPDHSQPVTVTNPPFRFLGYNTNFFHYLPNRHLQVIKLTADQHTQKMLIAIAPLNWWESTFPSKTGTDWNAACNWLYDNSYKKGLYDDRLVRGCGTWIDDGKVVQHNGDKLFVDGVETSINDFKTRYIYNASFAIEKEVAQPLSKEDATKFLKISKMFSWEKPIFASLLSGWCVIAPVCGALSWRPHAWITGQRGCGKSWIVNNYVIPSLGKQVLQVTSKTSEPGIRQALGANGSNAFPVVHDECEGEDQESRRRLQSELELMRTASCDNEGYIYKGTAGGKADAYIARSCFLMSSIGVNIMQAADASRITILSLLKAHKDVSDELFDEIKNTILTTMTPQYCASLRARTLHMLPTILENTKIFTRAVSMKYEQRTGDQFGPMLAGAYSLFSDNIIDPSTAMDWISKQDWSDQPSINHESDERRCLNIILEHTVTYQSTYEKTRFEKTIGEILYNRNQNEEETDCLERIGIRIKITKEGDKEIMISVSHKALKKILADTPWQNTYSRILKRLDDSVTERTVRFKGTSTSSIVIPMNVAFPFPDKGDDDI